MRIIGSLWLLSGLLPCLMAGEWPSRQIGESYTFVFYNDFWVNLHHTLSAHANPKNKPASLDFLPEDVRPRWREAVNWYKENPLGSPVFSKKALAVNETLRLRLGRSLNQDLDLPPGLPEQLTALAPLYREHLWPQVKVLNEDWFNNLLPRLRDAEQKICPRLANAFQTKWPRQRIRVDLVVLGFDKPGYTTAAPNRVTMVTGHPRIASADHALEILFHEASHLLLDKVEQDMEQKANELSRELLSGLWHVLLFHTVGYAMEQHLAHGYQAYGDYHNIYSRRWSKHRELIQKHWQPYLEGKLGYNQAIAALVAANPDLE